MAGRANHLILLGFALLCAAACLWLPLGEVGAVESVAEEGEEAELGTGEHGEEAGLDGLSGASHGVIVCEY